MGDTKMRAAVYEIAVLGRGGLDIASSNGNHVTEVKINGSPIIVGVNAYIRPEH
jgi:hypothetical protein